MNIVLKDRNGANVTFNQKGYTNNGIIFEAMGTTLLDRKRLSLQITEGANVNRVKFKLSVPSVCQSATDCSTSAVQYTLVASGDLSVVRFSSNEAREDLAALVASLAASAELENMVTDGVLPG